MCFTLKNGQSVAKCDWVQYKKRYHALSLSIFDSVKSTRKLDKFSIYMQKYRLILLSKKIDDFFVYFSSKYSKQSLRLGNKSLEQKCSKPEFYLNWLLWFAKSVQWRHFAWKHVCDLQLENILYMIDVLLWVQGCVRRHIPGESGTSYGEKCYFLLVF